MERPPWTNWPPRTTWVNPASVWVKENSFQTCLGIQVHLFGWQPDLAEFSPLITLSSKLLFPPGYLYQFKKYLARLRLVHKFLAILPLFPHSEFIWDFRFGRPTLPFIFRQVPVRCTGVWNVSDVGFAHKTRLIYTTLSSSGSPCNKGLFGVEFGGSMVAVPSFFLHGIVKLWPGLLHMSCGGSVHFSALMIVHNDEELSWADWPDSSIQTSGWVLINVGNEIFGISWFSPLGFNLDGDCW
jgi:hypothetical protein